MSSESQFALVTGATGAIGPSLVRHLIDKGWRVRALVRGKSDCVPKGADLARGDITDEKSVATAMAGIQSVFHLAAKLHINNPSPKLASEYEFINVKGTENLISAAKQAGVRRFVFFSTINIYGSTQAGGFADEMTPPRIESIYAKTKYEAEHLVLKSGVPAVVLRLAAVYGRGMKGNYLRLMESLKRRRFAYVGNGANRRTLVYLNDVCGAAELAARDPRAPGQIFNVTDGQVHTLRDIVTEICGAIGITSPRLRLPIWPMRFAAGAVDAGCRIFGRRGFITAAMIDKLTEDIAVRGEKIQRELEFRPGFSLAAGWRDIVGQSSSTIDTNQRPVTAGAGRQ